jgi:Tfp pilus assembly protein FimT
MAVIALSFNHRTGADQRLRQSMKKVVSFLCLSRTAARTKVIERLRPESMRRESRTTGQHSQEMTSGTGRV